jgi:hypothetical protein
MGTLLDLARTTPGLATDLQDVELDRLLRLVARHYGCPPDEVVLMQECARRDRQAALRSFQAMANELGESCGMPRRQR